MGKSVEQMTALPADPNWESIAVGGVCVTKTPTGFA